MGRLSILRRAVFPSTRGVAHRMRALTLALVLLAVLGGCSSDSDRLSEELVASTQGLVAARAGAASVDLGEADAACVARRLTDDQANDLARSIDDAGLSVELAGTVARAVLDCVDPDQLIRSATAPFTVGVSEASVDCIASRLNEDLTESLIAANLQGVDLPAAQVELELATALGLCLEPDELLDRG